jgi:ketosteroid isomerase-like protein
MSQENVEIVRGCFDTFNAWTHGEVSDEAAMEWGQRILEPQFEYHWHSGRGMLPDEPQHIRGLSEFAASWVQMRDSFVDLTFEPLEFIQAPDDRVLVPIRATGLGRESGAPVADEFFQVWTFRDGKVRDVEELHSRAEALEAAGLSE